MKTMKTPTTHSNALVGDLFTLFDYLWREPLHDVYHVIVKVSRCRERFDGGSAGRARIIAVGPIVNAPLKITRKIIKYFYKVLNLTD